MKCAVHQYVSGRARRLASDTEHSMCTVETWLVLALLLCNGSAVTTHLFPFVRHETAREICYNYCYCSLVITSSLLPTINISHIDM